MKEHIFPLEYNDPCQYYWYNGVFSKDELSKIYHDLATVPFQRATVIDTESTDDIRKSNIKWIPKTEQWDWLYEKLIQLAINANNELWHFDLHTAPENIQYTEYDSNELGHYDWHQDIGPNLPSIRKVSITVQLSDSYEYEGGDLEIWMGGDMNNSAKGPRGAGNVIIFPSYMPHRVSPVTKGIRRSFVLWLGGAHYK